MLVMSSSGNCSRNARSILIHLVRLVVVHCRLDVMHGLFNRMFGVGPVLVNLGERCIGTSQLERGLLQLFEPVVIALTIRLIPICRSVARVCVALTVRR